MAKYRIKPEFRNVSRIINHRINNPRNEPFQKDPSLENEPQSVVYRLNVDKWKRCLRRVLYFPPELAFHYYLLLSPHFQNDRTYAHSYALHVLSREPMSDVFEILCIGHIASFEWPVTTSLIKFISHLLTVWALTSWSLNCKQRTRSL